MWGANHSLASVAVPVARRARRAAPCGGGGVGAARGSVAARALRARWLLDARYGCKTETTALLVEWVQTVGAAAGIPSARVSAGSLGAPESRLELEIEFDSMADWEGFLSRIPAAQHRAWSQRVQSMVVDGSPKWEVFRIVDVPATPGAAAGAGAGAAVKAAAPPAAPRGAGAGTAAWGQGAGAGKLVFADKISLEDAALWEQTQRDLAAGLSGRASGSGGGGSTDSGSGGDSGDAPSAGDSVGGDGAVTLDWKGDPIKWSPGDKAPGMKFL
ncbi:hypothetical protein Rsub_04219 [Raphidocelis subcapitata]|uniref:Uncharacterized protein n=1 Tax=Raphidocelis subcapitata TaxID=307507 RepID=A0A2V0NVY1_9CHLO|nr:hypothetical protein Rsub_04219 [Raphidocelis subcapitata]|eukprot:GBF91479.1 hypothetical protein Rsub_04219 [Raphidocelis subcapitata]